MLTTSTRRFLPVLTLTLLVAPLAACELAMANLHAEAREPWSQKFTLAPNGRLELENTNGSITVEPATGPEIEVTAERIAKAATDEAAKELLKQVEVQVEQSGDRLRLKSKYPRDLHMARVEIRYSVKVPASVSVKLENTNGKITLTNLANAVDASTTNGGVSGSGLTGAVKASTTNGGLDIDVNAVDKAGIELSTTNGGVSLHLPSAAKADVSASCVNGGISMNGLTLDKTSDSSSRRQVEGRLNGGGPRVRVETVNGGVRIAGK
jgi:DUF4097 and DUF4098 domain-containing protein YvlB